MTPTPNSPLPDTPAERVQRLLTAEVAVDLADMVRAATGIDPARLDVEVYEPTGEPGAFGVHRIWDADGTEYGRGDLDALLDLDETSLPSVRAFCAAAGRGDYDLTVDRTAIPLTAASSSTGRSLTEHGAAFAASTLSAGYSSDAAERAGQILATRRISPDADTLTHAQLVAHMTDQHRWGDDEPLDDVPAATIRQLHADDHADDPAHTARTDHTHDNDTPPTLFDMPDDHEPARQKSPMDTMAADARQRAALRQQQKTARIRRHDVEQAISLHTGTILQAVEATLADADQDDIDWDGVNVMFELVDGHIPLVYVNVSAAIDDDETRDEIDTEIERDLNRHPDLTTILGRLADDWGPALTDETVWIARPTTTDAPHTTDGRLLADPATLTASRRRTLAGELADLLGTSRRAAYTLIDDGLPTSRLGDHTDQVADLLDGTGR